MPVAVPSPQLPVDALERRFAAWDRERFGAPSSLDRLITATHERFPDLWSKSP
jgi:hypothetical protein